MEYCFKKKVKMTIKHNQPKWFWEFLKTNEPKENEIIKFKDSKFKIKNSIPRFINKNSENQQQTSDTFGYKWKKRDTFENNVNKHMEFWLNERYGEIKECFLKQFNHKPYVLDAGCGGGMSGMLFFKNIMKDIYYVGADISSAVDVAASRFLEKNYYCSFIQCDLTKLPFAKNSFDIIFSEGVLHHTDNTFDALASVSEYLKKNGKIYFYVYKKKSPIREFSDDFIREKIQNLSSQEAWNQLLPLTKLGKLIGELNAEIDIKEKIDLLEIPSGKINIQRLFYWHIFKIFYRPEMSIEEMNHINFDWYAPKNAFRQSPEEVRSWCKKLNLDIEREYVDDAGITIIAQKVK